LPVAELLVYVTFPSGPYRRVARTSRAAGCVRWCCATVQASAYHGPVGLAWIVTASADVRAEERAAELRILRRGGAGTEMAMPMSKPGQHRRVTEEAT
jgi:hypothetical protein